MWAVVGVEGVMEGGEQERERERHQLLGRLALRINNVRRAAEHSCLAAPP